MSHQRLENADLALKFREMADLLAAQEADRFRIAAFRRAAATLDELDKSVSEILAEGGTPALVALPGIGRGIAAALVELLETGQWSALDRLSGALEPERLFQTIPGIGPKLAHHIHSVLHVDTLEALEAAANDGRLLDVQGLGQRRVDAITAVLKQRLDHRRLRRHTPTRAPDVALLLVVDAEYRQKAQTGLLKKIAPKRFNPDGSAWLPVLHVRHGSWSFTALFSNTQRAHELDKTRDWVVIYAHEDDGPEIQCTVVTEHHGALTGRRVVRGREGECIAHYAVNHSERAR